MSPVDDASNGYVIISGSSQKRHRPPESQYSDEADGSRLHQWERHDRTQTSTAVSTGKRICESTLHDTISSNLGQQEVLLEGQPEVEWSSFISEDTFGPNTNWQAEFIKARDQVMANASYNYSSMLYSSYDHPTSEDEGEPWYPYDPDDNLRQHHELSGDGVGSAKGEQNDLEEACNSFVVCFGIVGISIPYSKSDRNLVMG
jgi:hypothetical protein